MCDFVSTFVVFLQDLTKEDGEVNYNVGIAIEPFVQYKNVDGKFMVEAAEEPAARTDAGDDDGDDGDDGDGDGGSDEGATAAVPDIDPFTVDLPELDLDEETEVSVSPAVAALVTSLAGNTSLTLLQLTHTQLSEESLALIGQALIPNTSLLQLCVGRYK